MKNILENIAMKDMEIEMMREKIKTAYQIISVLQQRVTELEQHNIAINEGQRQAQPDVPPMSHCLLLGDSNFRRVLSSYLGDNCSVKTIGGANINSVRRRIPELLYKIPTECLLYCGAHDVLDMLPNETKIDNISALISDLKEKNFNMKIYVCQIAHPSVSRDIKEHVESFNAHLLKWGETNSINIIKTTTTFRLRTGEIDDLCFEGSDNSALLNRIGIIRLLDSG